MSSRSIRQASVLRRSSLALALAVGMGLTGGAFAQATTGSLFGSAEAGDTVQITSGSGVSRTTTVGENGRYSFGNLPLGTYKVSLVKGGATVDSRDNVELRVNAGTDVSFANGAAASASNASNLEGVTVVGTALPPIDVSSVDSRTVITQTQLKQLPLGRTAEAIALLAPGVAQGASGSGFASPTGQPLVSFGGSSVSENAYYINGMNTTDPIAGYGGMALPYGAIDQQEILTGGYGAQYGRSDGGVISIVGRRGTNDFHAGGQILWTPAFAKANPINAKYPGSSADDGQTYRYRNLNKDWEAVYSAYAGGPLIKDTLFGFIAVEGAKREGDNVAISSSNRNTKYTYKDPKMYAKFDWNINDNNLLELTGASYKHDYTGDVYGFDNDTRRTGAFQSQDTTSRTKQTMWVAKYTSYITDSLTLTAQYGKQDSKLYTKPGSADPTLIHIISPQNQNPAYTAGFPQGITNAQNLTTVADPTHESKVTNYRFDLSYVLGDHTITAGIDNQNTQDLNDGSSVYADAGYMYSYGTVKGGTIAGGAVTAPVGTPYYVSEYRQETAASVRVRQRAQYIQDQWQVSDTVKLSLGLRNDQFTNYNGSNQAYITQTKPQWAPRLGGTWDVYGDSTFKVYANAGRYYLALPLVPALRGASGSTQTNVYYSYTGINPANGYPTGLVPLDTVNGPGVAYSTNNEYGQAKDPAIVTAKGLKSEYQDEFIAGFDKTWGDNWVYGVKATYRKLGNAIDDYCDTGDDPAGRLQQLFTASGSAVDLKSAGVSCYLFNPGRANTFLAPNATGGYDSVTASNADLGFPHLKRHYYALELHLQREKGDGKWWGNVSYVYSKLYGNSEGQTDSDAGTRSDPSVTQAWDNAPLMVYSNGKLANDHTHAFKAYGAYEISPEWQVSGNIAVVSGAPRNCYGGFGSNQEDAGYGVESYHFCGGLPSPPGKAGRNPMTHTVSAALAYRPAFAEGRLGFTAEVFNLFNEQKKTQSDPYYATTDAPEPTYNVPIAFQTPRYFRFGVTYDY